MGGKMSRKTDKEVIFQYIDRILTDQIKNIDHDTLRDILGTRTTSARIERLNEKIQNALQHIRDRRVRPYLEKRSQRNRSGM
jgi:hypothetical protein